MMTSLSVRARIVVVATVAFAALLLATSILIVRLVENDARMAAEASLAEALKLEAIERGETGFAVGDPTTFNATIDGERYELGLFDELSAGNATGLLTIDGVQTAQLEIDLRTKEILGVFDPDTGESLDAPDLRDQLHDLTFEVLDIDEGQASPVLVGVSELAEIDVSTRAVQRALLIAVPLVVLAFALTTWWMVGRALRPVRAMTDRVEAITTTNLDRRVPVPGGHDEIAELAVVMNQMLQRLEAGDEQQRRFSADASHELRSPLATVRIAAEMIEANPAGARVSTHAGHIMAEADRMDALVTDLLDLSLSTEMPLSAVAPAVDLGPLVTSVAAEVDLAAGAGVEGGIVVSGDEGQLRRLTRNLIENAQHHAAQHVCVGLVEANGWAELRVEDDGPGIGPEDRQRVFERFTRIDEGRSRNDGGFGLGLALVKSIAERHGGVVTIDRSAELGGARITVALPLAPGST